MEILLVPIFLGFVFFAFIIGLIAYKRMRQIPAPNEALIIVSRSKKKASSAQERVDGSDESVVEAIKEDRLEGLDFNIETTTTWVNPLHSQAFTLDLKARSTTFSADAHDKDKIAVRVAGVLLYKVGDNYEAMSRASRRFLDIDEKEMNNYIENLVTGQVRALVGGIGIEQLITNRQALMAQVRDATYEDMAKIGLQIDSLTVQEISDPHGYIDNLGRPQAEAVAREASIAADQARQAKEEAKQAAEKEIARVQRDTTVQAASYKAEQDKANETAAQQGPLARAQAERAVVEEQTHVAEMQVAMAAKRYDAEVRERAKAERFRVEELAKAEKSRAIAAAEAEAEHEKQLGQARAAAVRAQGDAEASAVEARGLAEAKATREKAQALAENGQAVIEQAIAEKMPEIARAVSEPIASADNLVILDGAEGMTKTVTGAIAAAGATADQIRGLVRGVQGKDDEDSGGNGGGSGPKRPDAPSSGGQRRRLEEKLGPEMVCGDEAPELASILNTPEQSIAPAEGGALDGDLDLSESVEILQDRFRDIDNEDAETFLEDLQTDPELSYAIAEVAKDDQAFEELLLNLPVRGFKQTLVERFLRSYRERLISNG
jgi:flotillin